jgi:O-antigen/teichoic acid export membrane protein
MLALGEPYYPLLVTMAAGGAKIILSLLLITRFGINVQAAIMSAYFVLSITLILFKGFGTVHKFEKLDQADKITL